MKKFFSSFGRFIIWLMAFSAFSDTIRAWNTPNWMMAIMYIIGLLSWWMWDFTENQ